MGMFFVLIGSLNVERNYTDNVRCIRHIWRRRDDQGWLPDPCEDESRRLSAKIVCAACGIRMQDLRNEG